MTFGFKYNEAKLSVFGDILYFSTRYLNEKKVKTLKK
jgi:hypothetical protein